MMSSIISDGFSKNESVIDRSKASDEPDNDAVDFKQQRI